MKLRYLLLLAALILPGQLLAQTPPPDCQINLPTITSVGTYNSVPFDNRSVGCVTWYLFYQADSGSASVVTLQSATIPSTPSDGDFSTFAGTIVLGSNPSNAQSAISAYVNGSVEISSVRVHIQYNSSGPNRLFNGLLYGYKAGNSAGLANCGNLMQAQPACAINAYSVAGNVMQNASAVAGHAALPVGGANPPSSIGATTFTGSGDNNALIFGTYNGSAILAVYCVQIDGVGTFKWGTNGACNNGATGVTITGSNQALSNGVMVQFSAGVNMIGDNWQASATLNPGAYPVLSGTIGSSAQVLSDVACDQSATISVSASGNTRIVTGTSQQRVHICSLALSNTAASDIQIISGTGATCGTSPTNMTGVFRSVVTAFLGWGERGTLNSQSGDSVCLNYTTSTTGGGRGYFLHVLAA